MASIMLISHGTIAQQRIVDSLTHTLVTHPHEDTLRLNVLSELAFYYSSRSPDSGLRYADSGISLSKKLHDRRH